MVPAILLTLHDHVLSVHSCEVYHIFDNLGSNGHGLFNLNRKSKPILFPPTTTCCRIIFHFENLNTQNKLGLKLL